MAPVVWGFWILCYFFLLCFAISLNAYTVSNTSDSGAGSLRQAILDANAANMPGSVITFTVGGTINLASSLPPIGPAISLINTSGNAVIISGSNAYQAFFVSPNSTTLTLQSDLSLVSTASVGGNGGAATGNAGGGALGAGGGLFVGAGTTVTIDGVSFSSCQAIGGAGGDALTGNGGSGGGAMSQGTGGSSTSAGGGGGGGYGGSGGSGNSGGGGGGGLFFPGGAGGAPGFGGGGGGGSDANPGAAASNLTTAGGDGGTDSFLNTGGAGGLNGSPGGAGTDLSGGGGGGGNATGAGGAGGNSALGAGGGGLGSTVGGPGGNSTGSFGGGGGGGGGTGSSGTGGSGGTFGGGGGGGAGSNGGAGGFGGGGGGAGLSGTGGNAGFGAGSGGGLSAGTAGFGGGSGGSGNNAANGGGGGAGLGGAIFIENGATLIVSDPFSGALFSSNSTTAGSGGTGTSAGAAGSSLGADIFLMSGGNIAFTISGSQTISSNINSDLGAGGGSGGGLTMNGAGVLSLSGTNTYTGTTFLDMGTLKIVSDSNLGDASNGIQFDGGTLEISNTLTSSRPIFFDGAATVTVDTSAVGTLAGNITGTGPFTMNGPGTLVLSGTNSYSGMTTIASGILQINEADSLPSSAAVVDNGTFAFDNPGLATVAGVISGTGVFIMEGSGTVALTATNDYMGGTFCDGGTIQITTDANLGNGSGTLTFNGGTLEISATMTSGRTIDFNAPGGTINVDATFQSILSGPISGSGPFTVGGPGTLILYGTNTFSGGVTITDSGNLQFNTPSSIPSGLNVTDNGILTFSPSSTLTQTVSGNISGTGNVVLNGMGTLILSGTNNYSGATTITSGTLQINSDQGLSSLTSGVSISNSGILLFNHPTTTTVSAPISGFGGLTMQGPGTLILSGTNTYTGETTITSGTLQINTGTSLPSASSVANDSALVFNNPDTALVGGAITGTGTLTMQGSGTTILSGNNTYTGITTISSGVLQINSSNGLPTSAQVVDNGLLAFNNSTTTTFSGSISGIGNVSMIGTGTTIFSGNNSYLGTTTLSAGILQIDSAVSLPTTTVFDNATLNFNIPGTYTYAGLIIGTGSVNNIGSGTLILSNPGNTFSGGMTIANGSTAIFTSASNFGSPTSTLTLNDGSLFSPVGTTPFTSQHPINLTGPGGSITIPDGTTTITLAGNITGPGSFTLQGAGTIIFTADNTYTGETELVGVTLEINNADSAPFGSDIINNGALIFNQSGTASLAGSISGSGPLTVQGTGTVVLSGDNTYTGQTLISSGGLEIQAFNSLSGGGDVIDNSVLQFNQTGTATIPSLISGSGSLLLTSPGTLVLSNNLNSYSGGTFVSNGGILQLTNDGELGASGSGVTLTDSTLDIPLGTLALTSSRPLSLNGTATLSIDDPSGVTTWQGDLTGAGSLNKQGPGTLILEGTNTYLGTTTISAGSLQINTTGSLPTAQNIYNNGSLVFNQTGTETLSGIISGSGAIYLNSGTTLALENTGNSYVGGTFLASGSTLQITSGFQLGLGGLTLNNASLEIPSGSPLVLAFQPVVLNGSGTILVDDAAGSLILQGNVSGGSLIKQGPGMLTLSGVNTYAGPTTISAGTLKILNSQSLPASSSVVDNGSLVFANTGMATVAGNISGTGNVSMQGSGTVILSGTNSYTGTTQVSSGTLQINTASSLPSSSPVITNGTLSFNLPGVSTISNSMSGTGGIAMVGSGTLILTGTNTYTGKTTVSSGTLQFNTAGSLASLSSIVDNGAVNFNATGTYSVSGAISGSGSVNLINNGTLLLSNSNNSYLGGTTISNLGTIQITNSGQLGNLFSPLTFNQGTLDVPVGSLPILLKGPVTLNGSATVSIDAPSNTVTLQGNMSGSGSLTQTGPGTLILSGFNTYAGTTTISAGVLQINNSQGLPGSSSVINEGSLVFNHTGTATISGGISGTGSLTMQGAGFLTLSGTNTYAGSTTISSGVVQINTAGSLPTTTPLADDGILNFAIPGAYTFSGVLSGSGVVNQIGSGTLFLSNTNNSYSGGTGITNGTMQWTNDGQLGSPLSLIKFNEGTLNIPVGTLALTSARPILLPGQGTIAVLDPAGVVTLSGNLYGPGPLIAPGPGTLILTGNHVDAGPIIISAGTLHIENKSDLCTYGDIIDESRLVFNHPGTAIVAGAITGAGEVKMQGSGTLVLSGNNDYSGPTSVESGTLVVNGSTLSPITVSGTGILAGSGLLNHAVIRGKIAPGNSIGTIYGANFTLDPSSSYELEFDNTTSDLISATNSVTINGGELILMPLGLTKPQVSSYTIISAPTIVDQHPFVLVNPLTRYHFSVQYDPHQVLLVLDDPVPFSSLVTSGNAGRIAPSFDELVAENPADLASVIAILDVQTPAQMASSLNQMGPTGSNAFALAEENVAEQMRQIYTNHLLELRMGSCAEKRPWNLWIAPFVSWAKQQGRSSMAGYREMFGGLVAAVDYLFKKHGQVTAGFTYAHGNIDTTQRSSSSDFNTYAGFVGAQGKVSGFFADALFSYLYNSAQGSRTMKFQVSTPLFSSSTKRKSRYDQQGNTLMGHVGIGYDFHKKYHEKHRLNIYPFANLDYIYLKEQGYSETGAGSLDLKVNSKGNDLLRPEAGLGIAYKGCFETIKMMLDISASYAHECRFLGKETEARFREAGASFKVTGLQPENNLFCSSATLGIESIKKGIFFTLGFYGEYGAHFHLNSGAIELGKEF